MRYCMDQCVKSMRFGSELAPTIVSRMYKDPFVVGGAAVSRERSAGGTDSRPERQLRTGKTRTTVKS